MTGAGKDAKSGAMTTQDDQPVTMPALGRGGRCPICAKPTRLDTRPFCSRRCADIDLGRWLGERYRIPADPDTAETTDTEDDAGRGGAEP